jgi:hypothetical protein
VPSTSNTMSFKAVSVGRTVAAYVARRSCGCNTARSWSSRKPRHAAIRDLSTIKRLKVPDRAARVRDDGAGSEPEGLLGRAAAEIRIEGLDGRFVVSPFGSDVPVVARLLFQIVGRFGAVFEIVHEIPHPQRFVS